MLVLVGQMRVEAGKMTAQYFSGSLRRWQDRSMDSACACLRSHADPTQRLVLEAGFRLMDVGMNPPGRSIVDTGVDSRKRFAYRRGLCFRRLGFFKNR